MVIKDVIRKISPPIVLRAAARARSIIRNWKHLGASASSVFSKIHESHSWGGEDRSGHGSDMKQTETVRGILPEFLRRYEVRTLLDLPCGAFNWMKEVELGDVRYIGADIVPALIEANQVQYGTSWRSFMVVNLISDPLPLADLLFCRDCLIHLPLREAQKALRNAAKSGITYILTTTYPRLTVNTDILMGDFRAINLRIAPFNFPPPLATIHEDDYSDLKDNPNFIRELALWRLEDLEAYLNS